jgi:regulator of protease activity HflC (stomatin/prohibitin superfamily)
MISVPIIIVGIIVLYLLNCIKVLREYERGVIFRLGRVLPQPKGPGLIFVFAPIDRMLRVSLRLVTLDIPPQDVITKDNVSVKVNAVGASGKLTEAADIISQNPQALQLRFLQTLTEIATEKNSTINFPLPMEFLRSFSFEMPRADIS